MALVSEVRSWKVRSSLNINEAFVLGIMAMVLHFATVILAKFGYVLAAESMTGLGGRGGWDELSSALAPMSLDRGLRYLVFFSMSAHLLTLANVIDQKFRTAVILVVIPIVMGFLPAIFGPGYYYSYWAGLSFCISALYVGVKYEQRVATIVGLIVILSFAVNDFVGNLDVWAKVFRGTIEDLFELTGERGGTVSMLFSSLLDTVLSYLVYAVLISSMLFKSGKIHRLTEFFEGVLIKNKENKPV